MAATVHPDNPTLFERLRLLPPGLMLSVLGVMVTVGVTLALSELSFRRGVDNGARVTLLLNRLGAAAEFRNLLTDVETGQRGFLLTGDEEYLAPYWAARDRFDVVFARLWNLTPEAGAREQLEALHVTALERLAVADEQVALARNGPTGDSPHPPGAGKELMDRFRVQLDTFEAAATAELRELRARQSEITFWPRFALVIFALLTFALLLAVAWLVLRESARHRAYAHDVEGEAERMQRLVAARTAELSDLSAHLQSVSERDKAELARNLHDELGGLLTAARMDLAWLQGATKELDPGIAARLAQLNQAFAQAMDVKRRVVESLRPALLDHFGLPTALQNHFEDVCGKAGLAFTARIPDDPPRLPEDMSIALFRVAQESLTNVVRHARARHVWLIYDVSGASISLRIRDDGVGMDVTAAPAAGSHGVPGMRHRIRSLGGSFTLVSSPGRGTEVIIAMPRIGPAAARLTDLAT